MDSIDKPLHVAVAEALGCKPERYDPVGGAKGTGWACGCKGENWSRHGDRITLLRYDTDWAVTGPLIEKHGISIKAEDLMSGDRVWHAEVPRGQGLYTVTNHTPLIAVCNMILALHKAGKLAV